MFSHTIFSLPFVIFSYLLATNGQIEFSILLWACIALFGARNGANAWNRIADYQIDLENVRTANRHLQTNKVSIKEGYFIVFCCYFIYFLAAWFISPICFVLAPIPLVLFTIYPYTKRFTNLCHLFLGLCCSLGILGAWIAGKGLFFTINLSLGVVSVEIVPLVLAIAILLWNAGFDTIYGCQDFEHDRSHNIHSIPATFGIQTGLRIAMLFHLGMIILLLSLAFVSPMLSTIYVIGIIIATLILIIEHRLVDVNNKILMKIASYRLNQVISLTICFFAIVDIYL